MRVIILSFVLLLCSCCPVDNSNGNFTQKKDEIVVNCSNKYKIYKDNYSTVAILYECELRGHVFLVNTWNECSVIHAPWCPCRQAQSTTESIFESNSYF